MAIFVAASDETASDARRGRFYFGGWVAPEEDWSRYFAPAWQERVLNGPPAIDYLHMADIKRPKWRREHGLTDTDAERRIDEAFRIIRSQGSLFPVMSMLDQGHLHESHSGISLLLETPGGTAVRPLQPDYVCFQRYATCVLDYVHAFHPDAEKVDFIIEVNGQITRHIQHFHQNFPPVLRKHHPKFAHLLGELIPASKSRIPLQAADLLCWYTRRRNSLNATDRGRYSELAKRKGLMDVMLNDEITGMSERARARGTNRDDDEDDAAAS